MSSYRSLLATICLGLSACLAAGPAEARRVALVIGNADYKIGPLANPVNDAAAVAEALERRLNFDKVILRRNLGAEAFRAALRELSREASGAELGVVYFAGHGIEVGGKNFLIPIDAALERPSALDLEAIPLDTVLRQLDGVTQLRLVILDACRNNIFLPSAKRSGKRGLARFEPESNTLVAYAAKEGTAADDGRGRHSPYTTALLKHIATPGLEINLLFRRLRTEVLAATGGSQQPAEYHSLGDREFFLVPPSLTSSVPSVVPPPPPSEAMHTWAAVKDTANIAALEEFLRRFGPANPVLARLAEARIEALRTQQAAIAKAEEDRRRAEEASRRAAAERERLLQASKQPDFSLDAPPGHYQMKDIILNEARWTSLRVTVSLVEVRPHSRWSSNCTLMVFSDNLEKWAGLYLVRYTDGSFGIEARSGSKAGGVVARRHLRRVAAGEEVSVGLNWSSPHSLTVMAGSAQHTLALDWSIVKIQGGSASARCRFQSLRLGPV